MLLVQAFVYYLFTFLLAPGNSFSITSIETDRNLSRHTRQTRCSGFRHRCESGQCVSLDSLCDGKIDCDDNSDETEACKGIKCQEYAFMCAYGACVDGNKKCNGKDDCIDKSDEAGCPGQGQNAPSGSSCRNNQFQCRNGNCISSLLVCDGEANCIDGSDETAEKCSNRICPSFTYRCAYGACVDGDSRCNRRQNCADNSDEKGCSGVTPPVRPTRPTTTPRTTKTTTKRPVTTATASPGCTLPSYPKNGNYVVAGGFGPGSRVSLLTAITYNCKKDHSLSEQLTNVFYCVNTDQWSPSSFPQCIATCPPLISTTIDIKCKRGEVTQNCSQPVFPGTVATLKCHPLYQFVGEPGFNRLKCSDGSWDYSLKAYRCMPVCGKRITKDAQTLIVNGSSTKRSEYPWQIGIYRNDAENVFLCGGSIISPKLILSAAHCFTNLANGALLPKDNYLLAAGKYFRELRHAEDQDFEQIRKVNRILIPESYRGQVLHFNGDIAVVVTETAFTLTLYVQTVCIDWENAVPDNELTEGTVTGWGLTKEGEAPALELKQLNVPYVDFNTCFDNVPSDFRQYLSLEYKLCAGYLDGKSVCQGDSGGPLVFKRNNVYFQRGIVSIAPIKQNTCDSKQYGIYTKVSKYLDFISKYEIENRVF